MSAEPRDKIFGSSTAEQAKFYAATRPSYPLELYQYIFDHHAFQKGSFHKLLDVGCGPGKATRDMASKFDEVIGADHGVQMIETARQAGGTTKTGKPIRYELSRAEQLDKISGLEEGSVDMLTAATSVHWFNMPGFWPVAARIMKPGGTVAFFTRGPIICHPKHPRAAIITQKMGELRDLDKSEHNHIVRNQYRELELPWQVEPPVSGFSQEKFIRKEWDNDGDFDGRDDFFGGSKDVTMKQIEALLLTTSTIIRWRKEHPDLVGTEEDILVKCTNVLREAAGMAQDEDGTMPLGAATTLLLFQRD